MVRKNLKVKIVSRFCHSNFPLYLSYLWRIWFCKIYHFCICRKIRHWIQYLNSRFCMCAASIIGNLLIQHECVRLLLGKVCCMGESTLRNVHRSSLNYPSGFVGFLSSCPQWQPCKQTHVGHGDGPGQPSPNYHTVTHILVCLLVIIRMTKCIHCVRKDSTWRKYLSASRLLLPTQRA